MILLQVIRSYLPCSIKKVSEDAQLSSYIFSRDGIKSSNVIEVEFIFQEHNNNLQWQKSTTKLIFLFFIEKN